MTLQKNIGNEGERMAAEFLHARGYVIRERQWTCRFGEIDLIAYQHTTGTLVFIEVKRRRGLMSAAFIECVDWRKQQRLVSAITCYLQQHGYDGPIRCDVVLIDRTGRITHICDVDLG
ncbi:MAG: YraN family protein [Patescibacteria group bacterium]